jgi:murein DD-endopeptidase MepM/ murein hydrolase activator NlpD
MKKVCWAALAALCCIASPGWANTIDTARFEEERVLGSADEQAQLANFLPFTRKLHATGIVVDGSLAESAKAAGIPAVAALELARAFDGPIDLEEDVVNGDTFSVAYRQEYTAAGHPIGVAKVEFAELSTAARGTLSVHRFRPSSNKPERLWLASGQATGPTALRWPVDDINISSGFGLRSNPMAKQVGKKKGTGGPVRAAGRFGLLMHHGVDFAAETGTPIYAAAAGTVTGARPNGGYGNWIQIQHEGEFETVYGHLSAFAPGIVEGVWVERGELIGFVGSTGRSTGPHLHFELRQNDKPTDPVVSAAVKRAQMRGGELARFRRTVARDLDEARREVTPHL